MIWFTHLNFTNLAVSIFFNIQIQIYNKKEYNMKKKKVKFLFNVIHFKEYELGFNL